MTWVGVPSPDTVAVARAVDRALLREARHEFERWALESAPPSPAEALERREFAELMNRLGASLKPKEREVMRARFGDDATLREIAETMRLSVERVRQLEQKALRKLRYYVRCRAPDIIERDDHWHRMWVQRVAVTSLEWFTRQEKLREQKEAWVQRPRGELDTSDPMPFAETVLRQAVKVARDAQARAQRDARARPYRGWRTPTPLEPFEITTMLERFQCSCGRPLNHIRGERRAKPGDFGLCEHCGQLLELVPDGPRLQLKPAEWQRVTDPAQALELRALHETIVRNRRPALHVVPPPA